MPDELTAAKCIRCSEPATFDSPRYFCDEHWARWWGGFDEEFPYLDGAPGEQKMYEEAIRQMAYPQDDIPVGADEELAMAEAIDAVIERCSSRCLDDDEDRAAVADELLPLLKQTYDRGRKDAQADHGLYVSYLEGELLQLRVLVKDMDDTALDHIVERLSEIIRSVMGGK